MIYIHSKSPEFFLPTIYKKKVFPATQGIIVHEKKETKRYACTSSYIMVKSSIIISIKKTQQYDFSFL